jgi:hypothetical protein
VKAVDETTRIPISVEPLSVAAIVEEVLKKEVLEELRELLKSFRG